MKQLILSVFLLSSLMNPFAKADAEEIAGYELRQWYSKNSFQFMLMRNQCENWPTFIFKTVFNVPPDKVFAPLFDISKYVERKVPRIHESTIIHQTHLPFDIRFLQGKKLQRGIALENATVIVARFKTSIDWLPDNDYTLLIAASTDKSKETISLYWIQYDEEYFDRIRGQWKNSSYAVRPQDSDIYPNNNSDIYGFCHLKFQNKGETAIYLENYFETGMIGGWFMNSIIYNVVQDLPELIQMAEKYSAQ